VAKIAITKPLITCVAGTLLLLAFSPYASAAPQENMALERWAKLREAERYQMQIAEKYYLAKNYEVAAEEYDKFQKLYERSEAFSFALLKWAHCKVELRKQKAAIKDGYQTVLDSFPNSPEGPLAAMYIGRTYRGMGDMKLAKTAYGKTISTYPDHYAAVLARLDLVEIAVKESDTQAQTAMLRELTYNIERKGPTVEPCSTAAKQLTRLMLMSGDLDEALKALATTYKEDQLASRLMDIEARMGGLPEVLSKLTGSTDEATKKTGEKLAEAAAIWLKQQVVENLKDEKKKAKAISAWYAIAEVRRAARQPEKQRAIYEEMLASQGVDDTILGVLAQWHKDNKQTEQARATYAKYKDVIAGQALIAASFSEEKQFDKAAELYRKLAVTDTKSPAKWEVAAASAYRSAGKPDLAIAIYRELLTSDVKNAGEHAFQIAETFFHAGRWKESIQAYRGTDRYPLNTQRMAIANRHLKQYDEAIALFTQIKNTSPPHASEATYDIAVTLEMAGPTRKEEAISMFKAVCRDYPKSREGSQAHSHLFEKYKITYTLGGAKD